MEAFLQLGLALMPYAMMDHTHCDFDWHSRDCVLLPLGQPVATTIRDDDTLRTKKQLGVVAVVSAVWTVAENAAYEATCTCIENVDRTFNVCVYVCVCLYICDGT